MAILLTLAGKFWRDIAGSILVEYTIVFPVFILVTLGTVDAAYMFADWAAANKAVYRGARTAIVSDPVAQGITTTNQGTIAGQWCFNFNDGTSTGDCPASTSVCTGAASSGTCVNDTYTFNDTAFTNIVTRMQAVLPTIQRQNVTITYKTTGYGYALYPGGLPMTVQVSLNCMTHRFYFLGALMNWVFTPPAGCSGTALGPAMPTFATSLTSEDMATN
jgi:Flp pilus assembly protein TadG